MNEQLMLTWTVVGLLPYCLVLALVDPPGMPMYIELKGAGGDKMPKWLCVRGTSQLEGYHSHLNNMFTGTYYSTRCALLLKGHTGMHTPCALQLDNRGLRGWLG